MATAAQIEEAAAVLRRGGLVAFPTETVYGLGANALDENAVNKIFEVKGRPATSPLIVHASDVEMARGLAAAWPEEAERLAARYWPGPLTLVLPKSPRIPDRVTAGLGTVGLRIPRHPVALELIRRAGVPVAAPSANLFTAVSPTNAGHVRAGLGDKVDAVLDGGASSVGIESAVVSLAGPRPILLRPGAIDPEELKALLGDLDSAAGTGAAHPSPGMHERHYRPRKPLHWWTPGSPVPAGQGAYLTWRQAEEKAKVSGSVRRIQMPSDPAGYAAILYETLHRLDREPGDFILVEPVPGTSAWSGVRDRLTRAAER